MTWGIWRRRGPMKNRHTSQYCEAAESGGGGLRCRDERHTPSSSEGSVTHGEMPYSDTPVFFWGL
jgi:hypothetical protein